MTILSKTVALVSGGSSGLGAAAVKKLIQGGARGVVVADLNEDIFHQTFESYSNVIFHQTDVTDEKDVSSALDLVEKHFGEPVSAAISCAGIATACKTLSKKGTHLLKDFQKVMNVNAVGSFNVARLAAERISGRKEMEEDGLRGCIINTASIAAFEGQIGQVAYAASKGAVVGMTLPMARDLASFKIRVMTIAPGLFETPLLSGLPENVKAELGKTVPCPSRLGQPDEFGQLVCSILENPMLNGSVIRLDGALRMPP